MLHFFRKMRKALIPENRFGRYFFYAGGEIVLVVIGILIALQVNNWNQERNNRKKEKIALQELIINLETNIEHFTYNISMEDSTIVGIDIIINHLANHLPYHDSLNHYFKRISWMEQISIATSTFDVLKSNGFDLINSESLKSEIVQLFNVDYPHWAELIKDAAKVHLNSLTLPFYTNYLKYDINGAYKPVDYQQMLDGHQAVTFLHSRRVWKTSVIFFNTELKWKSEHLIEEIKKELSK